MGTVPAERGLAANFRKQPGEGGRVTLLLDTTVLIDILCSRNDRRALLAELVTQGHKLSTAAINIAEIHAGMRPGEEEKREAFLTRLHCFPMTGETGRLAGSLRTRFARQGKTLELPDMIVAATALEKRLTLMTDNRKDFPIPELSFYSLP